MYIDSVCFLSRLVIFILLSETIILSFSPLDLYLNRVDAHTNAFRVQLLGFLFLPVDLALKRLNVLMK